MTDNEQRAERLKQQGEAKQALLQKYSETLFAAILDPTTLTDRDIDTILLTAEGIAEKQLEQMNRIANEAQAQIDAVLNEQSNDGDTVVQLRPH